MTEPKRWTAYRRGALLGRVRTIARRFPNGGTNDGS